MIYFEQIYKTQVDIFMCKSLSTLTSGSCVLIRPTTYIPLTSQHELLSTYVLLIMIKHIYYFFRVPVHRIYMSSALW